MAKRDKTLLIVGGLAVAGLAIYMLTKKSAPAVPPGYNYIPVQPGAAPSSPSLLTQAPGIISSLANLFGGGNNAPAAPAGFVPVSLAPTTSPGAPSPAAQFSQISTANIPSLISGIY